jgi:hypothetical protein
VALVKGAERRFVSAEEPANEREIGSVVEAHTDMSGWTGSNG